MDLNTLDELDQTFRAGTNTRSELNLSKLDLKAPGRAQREYEKGLRLFVRKDFQNAAEHLTEAIEIYPNFVSAHNALGCTYFSAGQNDSAVREFNKAIQLDDHLSTSYMNLGRVELALSQTSAAQTALEKAFSITPLNSNVVRALAYTQYLNHDYAGAIQTAQQAHSHTHPGIAVVHYFAAAAWQAQNHLTETRDELETFLTEDPNSPFAEQAKQIIQQIQTAEAQQMLASAARAPVFSADSSARSLLGEKTLQDLKEKQQIADAEKAEEDSASYGASDTSYPPASERFPDRGRAVLLPTNAWILHSAVDEVAMFFTVTDHGRSVVDLKKSEIAVSDDRKPPATVLSFRTESELPLRLGLVIDTSGSITERFAFEQSAAIDFLQKVLTGQNDLAFAAGFSNSVVLVQDFTDDVRQLSHGINQLVPVGGTAIWDAVSFAADKLAERKESRPVARMIVVISDGDDNASSTTLKQAIERAEHDEVSVYTVSTRNDDDPQDYHQTTGNRAMKTLAEYTGGMAFFPGWASHLKHSLSELQQVIRSRYLISYRPALFRRDGRYRVVEMTAARSGHKFKVNARKGYYSATN